VFRDAVALLDDEKIEIEVGESQLTLRQGATKLEFPTIPGTEFPLAPPPVEDGTFYMDSDALELAFGRVLHAASNDAARPILTGVLVSMIGGTLTTVAADGFRMGVSNVKIEDEREYKCVIPAKSAAIVLGALAEGEVVIMPDTMRIGFVLPEKDGVFVKVYCQLIEGNFVNYKQIIPTTKVVPFFVDKEDLVKALKLGKVFARGNANIVTHILTEDTLSLHAHSIEDGEFDKSVNGSYDGEEVEFGMNYAYELDSLNVMGDVIAVECQTPHRPIVLYTEGRKDEFLCVLMPMHIRK
jgi:DNA polymerase-3 subunit beta